MAEAFRREDPVLPACRGRHPHLREATGDCGQPLRAILLGASNSWFADTRSVLSVPTRAGELAQLVEEKWLHLTNATSVDVLKAFLASPGFAELAKFDVDDVWQEIEARREPSPDEGDEDAHMDLKGPEWEVLSNPDPTLNGKDFLLREVDPPTNHSSMLEAVVLAERLREVNALIGFTRLRSPGESSPTEARARRAPLSSDAHQDGFPRRRSGGRGFSCASVLSEFGNGSPTTRFALGGRDFSRPTDRGALPES